MQGIKVHHVGDVLAKMQGIHLENRGELIAAENGQELVLYTMPAGQTGVLFTVQHPGALEFYYILEGEFHILPKGEMPQTLRAGDSFIVNDTAPPTRFFVAKDVRFLTFCYASFLDHAAMQETLFDILRNLQTADGDTLEHCERVRLLSTNIAQELRFSPEQLERLFFAARFHDVGKCRIPLEILVKPARLTREEYEVMKRHSAYSADMVREQFGEEVAHIVLHHHERYDGCGYPDGVAGQDIPLPARVIAVADAYDAMVTVRPYNKGCTAQQAMDELQRCAQTQFDPDCVRAMRHLWDSGEVREIYAEAAVLGG